MRGTSLRLPVIMNLRCLLWAGLLPLVFFGWTATAEAALSSAQKACIKSCKPANTACVLAIKNELAAASALCPPRGPGKKPCLQPPRRIFAGGKRACRVVKRACPRCCKSNGSTCTRAPELPVASGAFEVLDRKALDTTPFPPAADGNGFVLFRLPDGDIVIDPAKRTPVSAAAECAVAVLACFQSGTRNFAGCLATVPTCKGKKPWESDGPMCCPVACMDRYQELRHAGRDEATAFAAAIWEAPSCMPGVVGHVPEVRP